MQRHQDVLSCMPLQVLRQTQGLKESLSSSHSHAASLAAEVERLRVELEQCRQKAVTDQEQVGNLLLETARPTPLSHCIIMM
jgi:hypothetical protein